MHSIIKKIVGDLKYRDSTYLAKKFSDLLSNKLRNESSDFDIITCVPLHKKRLRQRKFNQAAFLCKNLLKYLPQTSFYPDLLIRTKDTKAQVELKKTQREKNLVAAFTINKKYSKIIENKRILLVDDVITTGATLENCSYILKKFGASNVVALTIAKTVFGK